MEISTWFIVVFALLWVANPLTQLLQLVAPKLHHRLGMTETDAFEPENKWYLLEEKAIAIADMSYLAAGFAFLVLAMMDRQLALIFGIYNCACYVYMALISIPRWLLLVKHGLGPLHGKQLGAYMGYMAVFLVFGLYGMVYLWDVAMATTGQGS